MSFSTASLPISIRQNVSRLCEYLRSDALNGAVSWEIDPDACLEKYGFVWAARRNYASVSVAIDERKGKVHRLTIQLPDPEDDR